MHNPTSFLARGLLSSLVLVAAVASPVRAETLGEVSTAFKLIGPNHKIVIEAYDDPLVDGVTCFVSRAKTGGITGAVGLATDKSDASIACRQVGDIHIKQPLPQQDEVFSERLSILFKRLRIVRVVDAKRQSLVYMTYSEKLLDGSPKNSITAVPVGKPIPVK
ncbi:CreA family protein [Sphaerotilus sp.]|jgi:CreA protein|uniref:CreA family protein n=1 Tax=Sphaerotilus sp. TaxID=2093942 RepID=UPI0025EEB523|nr:CreA family protein [Sphaerotilus sp.]